MIVLQYIIITLALWAMAYALILWHNYIDNKRLEPILKDFEYRQFIDKLKQLYAYDPTVQDSTSYHELLDLVEILPRESAFDKEAYLRSPQ